ncbi:hypothetical protein [Actinomadura citrea]|uniref:Uncharacterized protein n=1 Tax=Actinomadura citrea TaxID=46158 RepID=A0A7Y9GE19_9ACTN|nr:hypothetical protein [Actinomadura citrea]NYE14833.1 hypothetical protein [Actinomadura citrea]
MDSESMPTARPSISARTGVASLRLNTPVSAYGPAIPAKYSRVAMSRHAIVVDPAELASIPLRPA